MRLIDYFDSIYIINLPERLDRRRHMEREIKKLDARSRSNKVEFFKAIKPSEPYPFKSIGIRGVFLSHLSVLKEAQSLNLERILILEDDAQFTKHFLIHESELIEQLSKSQWDMVQFGYSFLPFIPPEERRVAPPGEAMGKLVHFSGDIIGAHCCGVNGKTFPRLIEFLEALLHGPVGDRERGPMPIDGAYNIFSRRPDAIRLVVNPSLVTQFSSRSDITPSDIDQIPFLKPVLSFLRKLGITRYFRDLRKRFM